MGRQCAVMEQNMSISRVRKEPLDKVGGKDGTIVPVNIPSGGQLRIVSGGLTMLLERLSRWGRGSSPSLPTSTSC